MTEDPKALNVSCRVVVPPPRMFMFVALLKSFPALVSAWLLGPVNANTADERVSVTPLPNFRSPYTDNVADEIESVTPTALADISNVPTLIAVVICTVPAAPVLSKTAVSCGSG